MRKFIISFLTILILLLLQLCIFPRLPLGNVIPNLLLILVCCYGFLRGSFDGMITGFICGLLIDIFSMHFLGFYAFTYMFVGYFNGFLKDFNIREIMVFPLVFIGISDLLMNLFAYMILMCLFSRRFNFDYYFFNVILAELIYTLVIAILLYPLIRLIEDKLIDNPVEKEKEDAI